MKTLLLVFALLTLSTQAFASASRYAYVTPETEHKYKLNVQVAPTNKEKTTYLIRLRAVEFPVKQAWLIVTPEPISSAAQNQRARFWGETLTTDDAEFIVPLRPNEVPMFSQSNEPDKEKYYEVLVPAEQINRTYIYIDFPSQVNDGGYFYSIDIDAYVKKDK